MVHAGCELACRVCGFCFVTTVACLVTAFASARRLSCQVAEVYDDSFRPVQKKKKKSSVHSLSQTFPCSTANVNPAIKKKVMWNVVLNNLILKFCSAKFHIIQLNFVYYFAVSTQVFVVRYSSVWIVAVGPFRGCALRYHLHITFDLQLIWERLSMSFHCAAGRLKVPRYMPSIDML